MTMLRCCALYAPRAGSPLEDYEDSFAHSADASRLAIADGASAAFESGRWARLLTESFVQAPPAGMGAQEILEWSGRLSARWFGSFDWEALNPFEQDRLAEEASGATLAGLCLYEVIPDEGGTWDGMALGDSCIFHVSGDRLVAAVPISSSADFGTHPPLFYTDQALTERAIGGLVTTHGVWAPGDRFLMLTDAMAQWFLREAEDGGQPWNTLADLDQESFALFIDEQRQRKLIDNDDVTAVIVKAKVRVSPLPGNQNDYGSNEDKVLAGSAGPDDGPGTPPEQGPPPFETYLIRLLKPAYLVPLVLALLLGFLIGKAIGGGSTSPRPASTPTPSTAAKPTPNPAPSLDAARAMDASADGFVRALVTSHGSLADYERSLDAAATAALAGNLTRLLHLTANRFTGMTSTGTIIFTAPGTAPDTVYVGARQHMTIGDKSQGYRFLLVLLTMRRTESGWRVSDIAFQPTIGGLLPPLPNSPQSSPPKK